MVEIIKTFTEYAHYISTECDEDELLFRGQNIDKPLVPRLARIKLYGNRSIGKAESIMFEEFKRQSPPYLNNTNLTLWDELALAQHHGLPTRLLDWTLNPFAALWFAVQMAPIKGSTSKDAVVWIFEPPEDAYLSDKDTNPFKVTKTKVFQPNHITLRIVAQSGWFTVHKLMTSNRFIPLNRNKNYKDNLRKIKIPCNCFSQIRRELDRCGFNHAVLFPNLDGVCKHIEWQNTLLNDECQECEYPKIKDMKSSWQ